MSPAILPEYHGLKPVYLSKTMHKLAIEWLGHVENADSREDTNRKLTPEKMRNRHGPRTAETAARLVTRPSVAWIGIAGVGRATLSPMIARSAESTGTPGCPAHVASAVGAGQTLTGVRFLLGNLHYRFF